MLAAFAAYAGIGWGFISTKPYGLQNSLGKSVCRRGPLGLRFAKTTMQL